MNESSTQFIIRLGSWGTGESDSSIYMARERKRERGITSFVSAHQMAHLQLARERLRLLADVLLNFDAVDFAPCSGRQHARVSRKARSDFEHPNPRQGCAEAPQNRLKVVNRFLAQVVHCRHVIDVLDGERALFLGKLTKLIAHASFDIDACHHRREEGGEEQSCQTDRSHAYKCLMGEGSEFKVCVIEISLSLSLSLSLSFFLFSPTGGKARIRHPGQAPHKRVESYLEQPYSLP